LKQELYRKTRRTPCDNGLEPPSQRVRCDRFYGAHGTYEIQRDATAARIVNGYLTWLEVGLASKAALHNESIRGSFLFSSRPFAFLFVSIRGLFFCVLCVLSRLL